MKSYFHQPGNTPYSYKTIPERVKKLAEESPDKTAIVIYLGKDERYQITRKELFDRSIKFAHALLKLGLKKGNHVAFCVANCIDWMSYDVGIILAGRVPVHLLLSAADIKVALVGKELYNKSLKFAQVLIQLGIKKGERIAYCVSNCIDWMVYDVGIMMTGAVAVHLLMGSADVNVTISGCVMIILDSKERWSHFLGVTEIHTGGKVTCDACPSLRLAMAVVPESRPTNALLASELIFEIKDKDIINFTQLPVLDPEDIAFINQTSGTTGIPKKVCHSHFNIINNFSLFCKTLNITSDDVCYMNRPMAYIAGYPMAFIGTGTILVTGDVSFLNNAANKKIQEDIWKKESCNIIFLQPQCMKSLHNVGFRVKMIYSGGDMITKEMIQCSLVVANKFVLLYGSTETLVSTQEIYTNDTISAHCQGMIGSPLPGSEVKIVDDKEEIVEMGKTGTLCFRTPWNTKGYDGKQVAPLKNGWFHTNDICHMQPDGKLLMGGRSSNFIMKGTVNISTVLIEDCIGSHPDVEQVVVVGVPDSRFGEEICACVSITSGHTFDENALKAHCEKKMSNKISLDWISMVPSYFLLFDILPTLFTEKQDRNKIKDMAIRRLNLN